MDLSMLSLTAYLGLKFFTALVCTALAPNSGQWAHARFPNLTASWPPLNGHWTVHMPKLWMHQSALAMRKADLDNVLNQAGEGTFTSINPSTPT